jgi:hypothetical protein
MRWISDSWADVKVEGKTVSLVNRPLQINSPIQIGRAASEEALDILREMDALPARRDEDPAAEATAPGEMWRQFSVASLSMGALILILRVVVAEQERWQESREHKRSGKGDDPKRDN